jgi:trans-aconitate methyltransferase
VQVVHDAGWANGWPRSWDRLEEDLVPDRELRIRALLDVFDAIAGRTPTVLDLACGTGTVTCRLLDRFPGARSIAVDVDPVLLTIASATLASDDRVRIVNADLRDPAWADALPRHVDAVLTATALHWLSKDAVQRLYGVLAHLVRSGGVFAHAEEMPLADLPRLGRGLAQVERERRIQQQADAHVRWDAGWEKVARDPALQVATAERQAVFTSNYPTDEFSPPADWHIAYRTSLRWCLEPTQIGTSSCAVATGTGNRGGFAIATARQLQCRE